MGINGKYFSPTWHHNVYESFTDMRPAFTVAGSVDMISGSTARFADVVTNIGGQYSTSTGKFTCQLPGIYVFTLHILKSYSTTQAFCKIRKNGSPIVVAHTVDPQGVGYYSTSNSAVLHLVNGDSVDVGECTSDSTIYDFSDYATTFSGFLLQYD